MQEIKIPPIRVESFFNKNREYVVVKARDISYEITELPEHGGKGDRLTPLEAFIAGLTTCETIMFQMISSQLFPGKKIDIKVTAESTFKMQHGIQSLKLIYTVEGLEEKDARNVIELVKTSCPVYNTLKKAINIEEEVIIK